MSEELSEIEKAKQLLLKEHEEKVKACADEIQSVLDKYGLQIIITKPEIKLQ